MIRKWINGWFGTPRAQSSPSTNATAPKPVTAAPVKATPDAGAGAGTAASAGEIDLAFYRWLTAGEHRTPEPGVEHLMLDELATLAGSAGAGAHLVPRVPAILPKLLRSLRDDAMSSADLARILAQDVVLVAEVIRSANSPFYRSGAPIKTVESAVQLLGQNGMRMIVARVAFRPVISSRGAQLASDVAPQLWRHAEKCARAANLLAPRMQANPFDAYLAGLMQNVGLIVALRLFDQLYPDAVAPKTAQFYAGLTAHARTISARIATMWEFPDTVAAAIEQAGRTDAGALARTLELGARMARLRMLIDANVFAADAPAVTAGLDDAMLAVLENLSVEED